ncbi:cell wall-binding repeat-containing protein [Romboutsia sedimentorum]|uniref:cell wall-binding repeat-containing protein n=1 Tax=Romboutsia sedimentorum TaxID=1368474 RepID=UPI002F40D17A
MVNSTSMVDALSATPLAKYNNAPILLTQANKLNSETKKEILRLKTKNVYIIGGKSVVSNSVINELKSMKLTVQRISGNDRYQTSLEIAKKLPNKPSEIAVVNGETGLPDAVSIAPVAAEKNMPIVLASPNQGTKVFDQYIKDNNINKSYVIGSEVAVSNKIANKLPNPERIGGIDRNETNALILEKFYTSEELNNIFVAKDGMKNPEYLIDALAVGVLASKEKSPVVIVGNDLNEKQQSLLSKKQPKEITQVGGSGNENAFNKLVNIFKN